MSAGQYAPFMSGDRARVINDAMSSLTLGRLYYVEHCTMLPDSTQTLQLIGEPTPWNDYRFERVPDPSPRKWPGSPTANPGEEWFGK